MKKIVIIASVALMGVFVLPSCKKDYTCTCDYGGASGQSRTNFPNAKKSDAKSQCDKLSADAAKVVPGASCSLD